MEEKQNSLSVIYLHDRSTCTNREILPRWMRCWYYYHSLLVKS